MNQTSPRLTLLVKSRRLSSSAMRVHSTRGMTSVSLAFKRRMQDRFSAHFGLNQQSQFWRGLKGNGSFAFSVIVLTLPTKQQWPLRHAKWPSLVSRCVRLMSGCGSQQNAGSMMRRAEGPVGASMPVTDRPHTSARPRPAAWIGEACCYRVPHQRSACRRVTRLQLGFLSSWYVSFFPVEGTVSIGLHRF